MKILIKLNIDNEIEDEEQLVDDLDECLSDFLEGDMQTYCAKTEYSIKTTKTRRYGEVG